MKIFMYCSLSLALVFSLSSAHNTFSQIQEQYASSQSQESHASSQSQEQYASSQESYASSQSQLGHDASSKSQGRDDSSSQTSQRQDASSKNQGQDASSKNQGHDASSQSQLGHDASSKNQGHDDASSQSQLGHDSSSQSQGRDDSSSQASQRQDASSKNQGHDASSKSQGHDASSKGQGHDAKSQGNDASSKSQEHDASNKGQGHDAKSQKNDASSKSQGHNAKSEGHDASSKGQGHNDAKSQGNDASSKGQGHDDAKSQGDDASSKGQGHDDAKSQGDDASSKGQGHDDAKSQGDDASSKGQGHDDAKSQGDDASSKGQGHDDAKSQGNDASSKGQGHNDAKSQGNDASSKSQEHDASNKSQGSGQSQGGLNASFEFHGSFKGCFSKVYAFGGSDTDTGNAHVLGGILNASSSTRLGDGRLVVDFLCDALSVPKIPAYKEASINSSQGGINFAVAGSTALSADLFSTHNLSSLIWKDSPKSFQTQIEWFNKFLIDAGCKGRGASCKADIGNSLFWVGEMGLSDFMSAIGSAIPLPHVTEISVRIVCQLLKAMLDNGAKYVVVQGLPPVGCLPAYMSSSSQKDRDHMGCVASANIGIISYNQILQERLQKFRKLYPHCSILYADYWNAYLTILTNPNKYEIEEPFKACCEQKPQGLFTINRHSLFGSQRSTTCKDPNKYISWDGIHLTEAMNKKLTTLFLNEGFCKPSFSELVKTKLKM